MAQTQETPARRRRPAVPLKAYAAEVIRVAQLTPGMRRITIGRGDLHEFVGVAPDQFITFILPQPGQERPQVGREINWETFRALPEDERPHARNYTVRQHRPEVAEIDVDFVLHGDDGIASRWAARAQPGNQLAIWGPRLAYDPPEGTDWLLLLADETGIPAVGAILDALPEGLPTRAFIEVADAAERQPLATPPGVEIVWLHRDGIPLGASDQLPEALRLATFPPGQVYAWGGGERRIMAAARKHLQEERGIATDAISILNYWRHGNHDE